MIPLFLVVAAACPLWTDIKKDLPDDVHWRMLNKRAGFAASVMWAMAPGTPSRLPEGTIVYLGTKEGSDGGILFFAKDNHQVCSQPIQLAPDGLKILMEIQNGPGDDL